MRILYLFIPLVCVTCNIFADTSTETQIKKQTEAYTQAFNKRDAAAMANFWTEDGKYTNPESGEVISGKANLENAFKERFKVVEDAKAEVKVNSISFPSKDTAIEVGVFHVEFSGKPSKESAFKAYFKQDNGQWRLTDMRMIDIASAPNQYQHLKALDWLIGEWVDADDDVSINSSYQWDRSKNFIQGSFSVSAEGALELEGKHIIGWDPIKKVIRAWVFDTDGTFGESTWTQKGNKWIVETAQTLATGERASSINIFTPIDQNSYTWESTGREIGGNILPNVAPITIKRKAG